MSNTDKKQNQKYAMRSTKFFNRWRRIFLFLVTNVFYMIRFKLVYRLEVYGKENIPKDNKYIVAANHLSTLDPPLVCSVMKRGVAYMAKKELFDNPFMRWWLNWLGAFAVDREKLGVSTIRTVMGIKDTNWVLGIFPQGGIRKDTNKIENIHKGFVMFAKKFKADIIPVAICGYDGYAKKLFEKHLTMKVGKPISYELPEDEIVNNWVKQICDFTGLEPGDEYKSAIKPTNNQQIEQREPALNK